jgi:diaminopimelate decarboxylase
MSAQPTIWTRRLDEATLASRTEQLVREGHMQGERAIMVHDLDRMTQRVGMLQSSFPASALHGIAVKANPLIEILKVLVEAGAGLECASMEEVQCCLAAGCPPEKIIFDSPAKTLEELEFAIAKGLHLNLDNFEELRRVAKLSASGIHGNVGMRINPQVGSGSISMTSVAGRVSKFGVPLAANRRELLDAYGRHSWLNGVHVHVGSQGCEVEQLVAAVKTLLAFREEALVYRSSPLPQVDIGGGLPVAYRAEDRPPELSEYVDLLRREVPEAFDESTRLLTEFGRSIHAGCGWAISRVEYAKHEEGQHMAVLHLGADAFMRPVYRPEDWQHEFIVLDSLGRAKTNSARRRVTLVGPLCFGGDILARDISLPEIEAGDLVVVRDCGAYTLSMWSRHCSRGLPKVIGWRDDSRCTLKRREDPGAVAEFWSL